MNLSDLLGVTVLDAEGVDIGSVRDVRLVQDGPIQGTFGAGLRVQGLIVGDLAVASRLGYDRLGTKGPWAVAAIVRRLQRSARWVPWADVDAVMPTAIRLRSRRSDLTAPTALPDLPTPVDGSPGEGGET
jgi:hypothetical protein